LLSHDSKRGLVMAVSRKVSRYPDEPAPAASQSSFSVTSGNNRTVNMRVTAVFSTPTMPPPVDYSKNMSSTPTLNSASVLIYFSGQSPQLFKQVTNGGVTTISGDAITVTWNIRLGTGVPSNNSDYLVQVSAVWSNCVSAGFISGSTLIGNEEEERKTKRR
jgi:hypothetical protein